MEGNRSPPVVAAGEYPGKNKSERRLLGKGYLLREQNPTMDPWIYRLGRNPMKPALCFAIALLIAGAITVYALPQDPDGMLSVTRSFSLDGRWYSVGKAVNSDSVIQKELSKRGNDISRIPYEILNTGGSLVDVLSEIPAKTLLRPILLPSPFRAEHSLQMESRNGFIEIASGKVSPQGDSFRKGLAKSGWKIVETKERGEPSCIAMIRYERETSIVFLEEREGAYLLIRHLEK
jgi:hypothetical protein